VKIADRVARLQAEAGIDEKEALKRMARELGQSKSDVYRELQRERARRRASMAGARSSEANWAV
jgi:16S rRNA (cytidine1402-2'-O)-methyltransferase